jgi:hypothetical protein
MDEEIGFDLVFGGTCWQVLSNCMAVLRAYEWIGMILMRSDIFHEDTPMSILYAETFRCR